MSDTQIFHVMLKLGGAFAHSIAQAWFQASPVNKARVVAGFPELVEEYKDLAEQIETRNNQEL
jgi:hypothetical protein